MELSSLLFFFIHGKIEDYERLGYLELLAVVVYIKPSKIWRKLRWDRELTISFSSESKILGPWKKLKTNNCHKSGRNIACGDGACRNVLGESLKRRPNSSLRVSAVWCWQNLKGWLRQVTMLHQKGVHSFGIQQLVLWGRCFRTTGSAESSCP